MTTHRVKGVYYEFPERAERGDVVVVEDPYEEEME